MLDVYTFLSFFVLCYLWFRLYSLRNPEHRPKRWAHNIMFLLGGFHHFFFQFQFEIIVFFFTVTVYLLHYETLNAYLKFQKNALGKQTSRN